jgi:hypothetical protein
MSLCNQRIFPTNSSIMVLQMIVPPHLECTRECSGFGQTLPAPITLFGVQNWQGLPIGSRELVVLTAVRSTNWQTFHLGPQNWHLC